MFKEFPLITVDNLTQYKTPPPNRQRGFLGRGNNYLNAAAEASAASDYQQYEN